MTGSLGLGIALLPLDDRPVNVLLPQDVGRIAGAKVDVPPADILPRYRRPGDTRGLADWLLDRASDPSVGHLIVSIDMLCFGGLIASRTGHDTADAALDRLQILRRIRARRPGLRISAVSLVMRASDSYSSAEEPSYWSEYGRELHRLGGDLHRVDGQPEVGPVATMTDVPTEVVSDFALRRIRNHVANLMTLTLLEEGTLDCLAITADDTAVLSYGSAEQGWLRHWMRLLPHGHQVLMYPGADEVGAVLVARTLVEAAGVSVAVRVSCPEPGGLERVPTFENAPLAESIRRQVAAAGASLVDEDEDVVLVVNAPDPGRYDMLDPAPPPLDTESAELVVNVVRQEVTAGRAVAVADVRYTNGCDPELGRRLVETGLLAKITSFGGWNTAGNTIGGVIASAIVATVGKRIGSFDPQALEEALVTRILDDFAYQAVIRREDGPRYFPDQLPLADDTAVATAEAAILERMNRMLATDLPFANWAVSRVTLPWRRGFEVGIRLTTIA